MIVLGQGDDVSVSSDFQTATARHLDTGTGELGHKMTLIVENGHVELISVRVAHQNVALVGNVDSVGKWGQTDIADGAQKMTIAIQDHHLVTLKVTDVVFTLESLDIRRFGHEFRAVVIAIQIPPLGDEKDGRGDAVDHDDLTVFRGDDSGHDVDEADLDETNELAELGEDLHAGSLAAAVANDQVVGVRQHGDLARVKQLAHAFAGLAERAVKVALKIENLNKN